MAKVEIQPDSYRFFSDLLRRRLGMDLGEQKEYLLESRLSAALAPLGLHSLDDLARFLVVSPDSNLEKKICELMTTNETLFFRDQIPFQYLQSFLLPELRQHKQDKKLRIWSAACSTGQEPYSIAMCLKESGFDWTGWKIEILATDISRQVLSTAQQGRYSAFEVSRGLQGAHLDRYFTKDGDGFVVKPELKKWIDFQELNLMSIGPSMGVFDVIFLRNVLIYFDQPLRKKIVNDAERMLDPKGAFFLGSSESILGYETRLVRVEGQSSSIYRFPTDVLKPR